MEIYNREQVTGGNVELTTSYQNHIDDSTLETESDDAVQPFAEVLFNAVDQVNTLQSDSAELEQLMVISPDEVNIHEVMIASEKARLSVSFMKTIVEKAMQAYNEIMTIR